MAGRDSPGSPTVAAVVREQTGAAWSRAKKLCIDGRVTVDGERCTDPAARVSPGAVVAVDEHGPKLRPGALARESIVFSDGDVVVVDKPAGMLSVADEPGNKDTLANHLRPLLRAKPGADPGRTPILVVHRLDRDTSGVMVFARTAVAHRHLAVQFKEHSVDRVYQAIVHGAIEARRVETQLVLDRGDGLRGSFGHFRRARGQPRGDAKRAVTQVTPIEALRGATLVECRLETGRQHQIRIHLAELGNPLVGERVYIRDYEREPIEAARPMLHARLLAFTHPRTSARVSFEREPPADFQEMLARLH
jgi:23S rRNA pseudouridine1911/1915/1917 synthase